ncbi:PadR family transcriptional regulator [Halobacteriales archaeon QS_9_68_42]|nr:MAG: PadR family transcriptional regulator [Halobacteriales archaeon QS_9_68_42]
MSENQSGSGETLQSLVGELDGAGDADSRTDPTERTEAVVEETADAVFDGGRLAVNEGLVKQSLPELLTALVELRTSETHGKRVMDDLEEFFGVDLSPGTVYPVLHDLEEEGLLSMHELVQTKEYSVEDPEATAEMLQRTMGQHLALGLVFQRALEEFGAGDDGNDDVEL